MGNAIPKNRVRVHKNVGDAFQGYSTALFLYDLKMKEHPHSARELEKGEKQ